MGPGFTASGAHNRREGIKPGAFTELTFDMAKGCHIQSGWEMRKQSNMAQNPTVNRHDAETCEVVILAVPKYSQLTLATLVEPMRMANTVANRELFRWRLCSDGRKHVESSSGFSLSIDGGINDVDAADAIFVVASYEVMKHTSPRVAPFLRKFSRGKTVIGGFDAAPYVLASAGLLDGYRATTHWDDLEDFQNRFPRVDVVPERYVIDRNRVTTSGSLPSFDLILEFIRRRYGLMLAMSVSGNFLYDQARPGDESQFMVAASLKDARHPKVIKVIKLMEQTLRNPLSTGELAASVGLSERSLLRRFQSALDVSPYQYYRALRLDAGRRLLDGSDLTVTEIAIACGFESRGSFTRAFKETFGSPPSRHRSSPAKTQA